MRRALRVEVLALQQEPQRVTWSARCPSAPPPPASPRTGPPTGPATSRPRAQPTPRPGGPIPPAPRSCAKPLHPPGRIPLEPTRPVHRRESPDRAGVEARPLWNPMRMQSLYRSCEVYAPGVGGGFSCRWSMDELHALDPCELYEPFRSGWMEKNVTRSTICVGQRPQKVMQRDSRVQQEVFRRATEH